MERIPYPSESIIAKCLSLNPDFRSDAGTLKTHPWLNVVTSKCIDMSDLHISTCGASYTIESELSF